MPRYYDRGGVRLTGTLAWALPLEDQEYKLVGFDELGSTCVSTVWLGLDHSGTSDVPVIFETMVK